MRRQQRPGNSNARRELSGHPRRDALSRAARTTRSPQVRAADFRFRPMPRSPSPPQGPPTSTRRWSATSFWRIFPTQRFIWTLATATPAGRESRTGTLAIGSNAALGSAAWPLTFDGAGTLQALATMTLTTGSNARQIVTPDDPAQAVTIDTNAGYTVTITGVISGQGGLTASNSARAAARSRSTRRTLSAA